MLDNRGIDYVWYEIFASGVEQWFHNIGPNQVNPTYEVFFEKHPGLGEILDELFPRVSLSVEPIFPPDPALMND